MVTRKPFPTLAWAVIARSPHPNGRWGICGVGFTRAEARRNYEQDYPLHVRAQWIERTVRCVVHWDPRGVWVEDLEPPTEQQQ